MVSKYPDLEMVFFPYLNFLFWGQVIEKNEKKKTFTMTTMLY